MWCVSSSIFRLSLTMIFWSTRTRSFIPSNLVFFTTDSSPFAAFSPLTSQYSFSFFWHILKTTVGGYFQPPLDFMRQLTLSWPSRICKHSWTVNPSFFFKYTMKYEPSYIMNNIFQIHCYFVGIKNIVVFVKDIVFYIYFLNYHFSYSKTRFVYKLFYVFWCQF